jgi:two-component system sensor histidine kinase HydH
VTQTLPPPSAPSAQDSRPRARRVYSRSDEVPHVPVAGNAESVKPSLGRWARWGWLITTIAMGAALLVTAWLGRQRARAVTSTLNRGQSMVLFESVRQQSRAMTQPPDGAQLDSLLRQHQASGLRYLAFFDSSGAVIAQAGEAASPVHRPARRPSGPPLLEQVGSRVRLWGFTALAPPPGPPPGRPARARPRLSFLMEFEPLVAERLAAEATQTFVLSALVAAALIAAAVVFWRLSMKQEATERRLEQQRRLGALGEMSAVLAHEIRNPLASLKGHAQLLAEHLSEGSPDRRKASLVVTEAERLEALTGDLLDFARSSPVDLQPADPAVLLASCAEEVQRGGFVIRAEGAPRVWRLDTNLMRQALTNVLRNARQASPEGTRPEATVGRSDGSLILTVRDFGSGIAPGDEKRIFSPFYTTRTTGTGLGLAVALRVVELHGGTITAGNHPDGGAVFRIAIPVG